MRFQLDLFINSRPDVLFENRLSPLRDVAPDDVDLVNCRENTRSRARAK
jgi:isocitrate/isopropylmalate dehydrogenase